MKKVLIYMDEEELASVGGPTGYVYNIKKEMQEKRIFDDIEFSFLHNTVKFKKMKKYVPKFIKDKRNKNRYLNMSNNIVNGQSHRANDDLNKYDIIHFHSTYAMYTVKDSLKDFNGSVVLTSHSPKVLHKEFIEDYIDDEQYSKNKEMLEKLDIMDEYAFNRADYIIFPCEYAEEPYYNSWNKYKSIHDLNRDKYRYLPTGIPQKKYDVSASEIRKKYGIPEDAFVISYVGRHNETKGYDQIKIMAEDLLKKYDNIYFLIAGKEEPLQGLSNDRWIECGWTNIASSIINASDVFLLPNKETYFDLVMLEVLSLGKVVLATETGGNKYFKSAASEGIHFYDYNNINGAVEELESLYKLSNEDIKKLGQENYLLYKEHFTSEKFLKEYIELLKTF